MSHYKIVAVARTPQEFGPPTLVEIAPIAYNGLSFEETLSGTGSIQFSSKPETIPDPVKDRLSNLLYYPTEIWLYEHSDLVAAGPINSMTFNAGTISFYVHSLEYYMRYMYINSDNRFERIDQFTIAKWLVDQWQGLRYGNFGIDTSNIGTSGVTRFRDYYTAENQQVYEKLDQLSDVKNGFDWNVDPATRELDLYYPERGIDLSDSVFLDHRNIGGDSTSVSVQEGDIASVGFGTGETPEPVDETDDPQPPISRIENEEVMTAFGRAVVSDSWHGVKRQTTLDNHTQKMLDERLQQVLSMGSELIPVVGADRKDFGLGDIVTYSFDFGVGIYTTERRVISRRVGIDMGDNISMSVELS